MVKYFVEILVTALIVIVAARILYKSIKRKAAGQCDCANCSGHCSQYKATSKK